MGQTIAEKVFSGKVGRSVRAGEYVTAPVDKAMMNEGFAMSWIHLNSADLHYDGPDGYVMLSQWPVGEQPDGAVAIGSPRTSVVEMVQVNGDVAAWAEDSLLWQADGKGHLLLGAGLDATQAIRIADSLE